MPNCPLRASCDVPSIGASIWPRGVDLISRGKSRIQRGIELPVKNWATRSEKLLQLCSHRS